MKNGVKAPNLKRFIKFCVVGGSGVVINMGAFLILQSLLGIDYRIAVILAIEVAIVNNFFWNSLWTFRDRHSGTKNELLRMFLRFNLTAGATAMAVNLGLDVLLVEVFGMDVRIAHFIGIAAGTLANYLFSHLWVFSPLPKQD